MKNKILILFFLVVSVVNVLAQETTETTTTTKNAHNSGGFMFEYAGADGECGINLGFIANPVELSYTWFFKKPDGAKDYGLHKWRLGGGGLYCLSDRWLLGGSVGFVVTYMMFKYESGSHEKQITHYTTRENKYVTVTDYTTIKDTNFGWYASPRLGVRIGEAALTASYHFDFEEFSEFSDYFTVGLTILF